MPETRQDLKLESDPSTIVRPNITGACIPANAIDSTKIANNAVTSGKILASSVTAAKLASNAVTTAKIADSNVTNAKIADGAITASKISDGAITASKLASNSGIVTDARLTQNWYYADEDITTIIDLIIWLENRIMSGNRLFYFDTNAVSTIDAVTTEDQEVYIYCKYPLQGISSEIHLTSDADVVTFNSTTAAASLIAVGIR